MTETISNVFILFFGCERDVVLVSFAMIEMTSDRSMQSFFLPFEDVLEGRSDIPGGVCDESVFILESPNLLVVDISARETQVR